ncbi:MAG: hypothetical protein WBH59_02580 [Atribacterales bacterium]
MMEFEKRMTLLSDHAQNLTVTLSLVVLFSPHIRVTSPILMFPLPVVVRPPFFSNFSAGHCCHTSFRYLSFSIIKTIIY